MTEADARGRRLSSRTRTATLAAIAVFVCALVLPGVSIATNPGNNGLILFTSGRDGNGEIYVMTPSGDNETNITNNAANDTTAEWNADGTKIVFASNRDGDNEIFTMNPDGSGVTQLTSNTLSDVDPTWSPDGTQIAFRRDIGTVSTPNNEIFTMTANGASQTNRTNNAASDFVPDWSPNGNLIAFQRFATGGNNEIFTMTPTGTAQTNITNNTTNDGRPSFSPDGTKIAFDSNRQSAGSTTIDDFDIYTMTTTGGSVTALTNNTTGGSPAADINDQKASWSPNGALLSFQSNRDFTASGVQNEIYRMTSTGTAQTRLTNDTTNDFDSAWQPDSIAPQTTITAGPSNGSTTSDNTPTFSFTSSETNSTFQCRVDAATFTTCTSPFTTAALGEGSHTFEVRATDVAGNVDATPASRAFTVDTIAPETTITSGPADNSIINDTTPTFEFTSSEPGSTFQCRYDANPFMPCTSPYTQTVNQTTHVFEVFAIDAAGNADPSPAIRTFGVSTAFVAFNGTTIVYSAPGSEPNDLSVDYVTDPGGDYYEFTEANTAFELNAGLDCTQQGPNVVRCPGDSEATSVLLNPASLNDEIDASGVPAGGGSDPFTIVGGAGNDVLTGTGNNDNMDGETGSDSLSGVGGDDQISGGSDAGMDRMEGGPGADLLEGGPGIDRAVYASSTMAANVSIDNSPNDTDGTGSTTENVLDTVESITGGSGDDVLSGSCFANTLAGQGGNDTLNGDPVGCSVGGGDFMGGGAGNDGFNGLGGTDSVTYTTNTSGQPIVVTIGGAPLDLDGLGGVDDIAADMENVFGGAGADTIDATGASQGVSLSGRAGNDTLIGSSFNDFVRGELGADQLDCGDGTNDMFDLDPADTSVTNCETPG